MTPSTIAYPRAYRLRLLLTLDERGLVDTSDYNLAIEVTMAASDDVGKRKTGAFGVESD